MLKFSFYALCLTWLFIDSEAGLAPFIDPCKWDDKDCLITSANKAKPVVIEGVKELGMPPLDPLTLDQVTYNEGGLNFIFNNLVVTGTKNCQITNLERNVPEKWIKLGCECPIEMHGQYIAAGKIIGVPIEGEGPVHVKTDNIRIDLKVTVETVDGSDGQKHWKIGDAEHTFDFKEKAFLTLENLYNGDEEKARPVNTIFDQSWKDIVQPVGKPIVAEFVHKVIEVLRTLVEKVPANELEQ